VSFSNSSIAEALNPNERLSSGFNVRTDVLGSNDETAYAVDCAPMTLASRSFSTGIGSPVTNDASTELRPSSTTPSTGTLPPGRTRSWKPLVLIGLMYLALFAAGLIAFVLTPHTDWSGMAFGPQWSACLICIPLFAFPPFLALVLAMRKEAPTNLRMTGAIIGLVAGSLGAAAFALHHSGSSLLFISLWYGGSILLCAAIGALLGPRLLRW
jgi:hypothetical protein